MVSELELGTALGTMIPQTKTVDFLHLFVYFRSPRLKQFWGRTTRVGRH